MRLRAWGVPSRASRRLSWKVRSVRSATRAPSRRCEAELALLAIRELELELRIAELEGHRWNAFSLVELEWITNAFVESRDEPDEIDDDELPRQANAELERRARVDSSADLDADADPDLR